MIPDTTAYMVAGFAVILAGILVYITSLIVRLKRIKQETGILDKILDEHGQEDLD